MENIADYLGFLFQGTNCPNCGNNLNFIQTLGLMRFHRKKPEEDVCNQCGVTYAFPKSSIKKFWNTIWPIEFVFFGLVILILSNTIGRIPILSFVFGCLLPIVWFLTFVFTISILLKVLRSYPFFEQIFQLEIIRTKKEEVREEQSDLQ